MRITTLFALLFTLGVGAGVASADRWNSTGWVKLGEREVNGRLDRDRISVTRQDGSFTKLTLVVENSDLELLDFEITFQNNDKFNPKVSHYFRENARTRVIDLPGNERFIKTIDLKYKNVGRGGRAKVEVWGFRSSGGAPPPRPRHHVAVRGTTVVGRSSESKPSMGASTRIGLVVGRDEGRFSKLMIVVTDSDLELLEFDVKFNRGAEWRPNVRQVFREGSRTRAIDLPGDKRVIKYIDFKYRNLPGGGGAKVQVWGK